MSNGTVKEPTMHHVRVRSTHGKVRIVSMPNPGGKPKEYWIYPPGHDLEVDDKTLAVMLADPILQVEQKDVPQARPRNMLEMASFADAIPKGSQQLAAQAHPRAAVDPSVLPGPNRGTDGPADQASPDAGDDDSPDSAPAAPAVPGTPSDDDGDDHAPAARDAARRRAASKPPAAK